MLATFGGSTRISETFADHAANGAQNESSTSTCAALRARDFLVALEPVIENEGVQVGSPSVKLSVDFFLTLPVDIPVPDISVDPDGEIAFDWFGKQNWLFSVSFSDRNRYSYASLRGPNESSGTQWFDDSVPMEVIQYIREVTRHPEPSA